MNNKDLPQAYEEFDSLCRSLEADVIKYFVENPHPDCGTFNLERIDYKCLNRSIIYAVPQNVEGMLGFKDDSSWSEGLSNVGEPYGVLVFIPPSCYMK